MQPDDRRFSSTSPVPSISNQLNNNNNNPTNPQSSYGTPKSALASSLETSTATTSKLSMDFSTLFKYPSLSPRYVHVSCF
jgi:hypothetical protein